MDAVLKKVWDIQKFLKIIFGVVPVVAGLDKFTNLLTNWESYLNPMIADNLPFSGSVFMMMVGVVEIIAGVLVLLRPKEGSLVVCAWLVLIALSLIASGKFFDVAVRDLVMAGGAFVLYLLTVLISRAGVAKG